MKRGTKETNYSDYTSSSRTSPAPCSLTRSPPALDSIQANLSTLRRQRRKNRRAAERSGRLQELPLNFLTHAGSFEDCGCCRSLRVTVQLHNRCVSARSGPILQVWDYFGTCPQTEEVAHVSAPNRRNTLQLVQALQIKTHLG